MLNDKVTQIKEKAKANINMRLVTSLVVASFVIGGIAWGFKKAGFSEAAKIVK